MHFARLANTVLKDEENARDNHVRVSQSILTRVIHCFVSLKKIRRCGVSVWSSGLNLLNSKTESYSTSKQQQQQQQQWEVANAAVQSRHQ